MALLFLGAVGLIGGIAAGGEAVRQQQEICKKTDDTYKEIESYTKQMKQNALALRCYDQTLKNKIFNDLSILTAINGSLHASQKSYQTSLDNLEAIVAFVCFVVMILLVAKRMGLFE